MGIYPYAYPLLQKDPYTGLTQSLYQFLNKVSANGETGNNMA